MSHSLAELRALLDDPLLVRSGRAMVLTPRAEALLLPLLLEAITREAPRRGDCALLHGSTARQVLATSPRARWTASWSWPSVRNRSTTTSLRRP
jgi:hypothetical protein